MTILPGLSAGTRVHIRQPIRLILVDDDNDFRESLDRQLRDEGCSVTAFSNGKAALNYLQWTDVADLCLLDWRMPVMGGIDVLREMRRRQVMTPVIFLTGVRDDACEEDALRDGAVDFVNKSRRLSVLMKRIERITEGWQRAAPPRTDAEASTYLRRGPLELRADPQSATWHGRAVDLTRTEFRILNHLATRPGIDVSFGELYKLVHGKDFITSDGEEACRTNVRSFIKRVRNKLRGVDPNFDRIQSYPRFGYRWSMT